MSLMGRARCAAKLGKMIMSHEEFIQTHSGIHTTETRLQARRCVGEGLDEAQIEISIKSMPRGGKRQQWLLSSFILPPAEARRLALAICPELSRD